jgi:hypothetical protein
MDSGVIRADGMIDIRLLGRRDVRAAARATISRTAWR